MNPSEIAPTKTNLFEYKGQLQFSIDGHSLLEEKREVLIMHLMEVIAQMKNQRQRLNHLLEQSYSLLADVELELGSYDLKRITAGTKNLSRIEVVEKSVMGVNLPQIRYRESLSHIPTISFASTSISYDNLIRNMREAVQLITVVAQTEAAAWRLTNEIKKTQRRVNALENVFIPDFKEIIKFIQDTLEERERETFFQMKRVKAAHEAAEEEEFQQA